jgi:glycerol-3-phosphate acyltransferase PlsY
MQMNVLLTILLSFLIGSFRPVSGRPLDGINIYESGRREHGDGQRHPFMGFKWGWSLGRDILKSVARHPDRAPVAGPSPRLAMCWSRLRVIGHNWSIIATVLTGRVRGGKGAATWWGAFLMMAPAPVIAVVALLFAGIVALTRYISLGVLASVAAGAASLAVLVALGQGLTVGPAETINIYLVYASWRGCGILSPSREYQASAGRTERRFGERA